MIGPDQYLQWLQGQPQAFDPSQPMLDDRCERDCSGTCFRAFLSPPFKWLNRTAPEWRTCHINELAECLVRTSQHIPRLIHDAVLDRMEELIMDSECWSIPWREKNNLITLHIGFGTHKSAMIEWKGILYTCVKSHIRFNTKREPPDFEEFIICESKLNKRDWDTEQRNSIKELKLFLQKHRTPVLSS